MIKILFLINTLSEGGAEKVLVDTVNNLPKDRYDVTVQTIFDIGVYRNYLNKNIKYKSIYSLKNKALLYIYHKIFFKYMSYKKFYNKYVKNNYDIEVAFLEGFPTKVISHSTDINSKKIAWVHTDILNNPQSLKEYNSLRKCINAYSKMNKIACVSNAAKESFNSVLRSFYEKTETIYNVIDNDEIISKSKEPVSEMINHSNPVFISCGRLCKQKGFDRLLRIHKKLISEGLYHTLIIIGKGEDEKELKKYISENNLNNSAFLFGYKKNPYKYIRNADLFICSSRAEGYSTVVTESVIIGTPVLSTMFAGANEPVNNPRCSLIVDNNEDSLFEAIKEILINPEIIYKYKKEIIEKQKLINKNDLVNKVCEFLEESK